MVRLADMGFEQSLLEPEEKGNFAAYERAKRILSSPAAEAEPVAEWRHKCAKSNFHDHDGCSCSDAELRTRYAHPFSPVSAKVTEVDDSEVRRRYKAIANKLAAEGGGTWAAYMMIEIDEYVALAALNGGRKNG